MHFIQEIRFLKAYYWANLGKFAFTPEDRIEWTDRAKKDFDVLGISSDTYCNPDPENLYYRGFPADLCTLANKSEREIFQTNSIPETGASTSENTSNTVPNHVV
jgi:hypothetical protein